MRKWLVVIPFLVAVCALSGVTFAQSTTECPAGQHLFSHKLLATDPVCIPDNPQRIVVFENAAAELLLFTDKQIVGTFQQFVKDELTAAIPVLGEKLAPIPGMGWPANLELILSEKPDLIAAYANETMPYDQLSQIAPTVIFNAGIAEGNWQTATEFWSEVFNVPDLYQSMLDTYNARVAELQAALGDDRADRKVSLVLASSYFNMIYTKEAPAGYVLQDVGLGRPDSQNLDAEQSKAAYENTTYAYLSDETLNLADGDDIFVFTFPVLGDAVAASDDYLKTFESNPLWQSLSAVKAGRAYAGSYAWTRANTYLLANTVLDDLFKYLAHTEPTIPNPALALADTLSIATPESTAESGS
jgi:iron complex transport system substrate-binding protein